MVGICRSADLVENMAEMAKYLNIVGGHLLVMNWALRRLVSLPKLYPEIAVKENWFWRNSRHVVAVTSASPKGVVVASMLC